MRRGVLFEEASIVTECQNATMARSATVEIDRDLKARLRAMKSHKRETYNEVIERLLDDLEDTSPAALRRYDEILQEVRAGKSVTHEQVKRDWNEKGKRPRGAARRPEH